MWPGPYGEWGHVSTSLLRVINPWLGVVSTTSTSSTHTVVTERVSKVTIDHGGTVEGPVILGNSIAVNGACLSIVAFDSGSVSFDLIAETVSLTNLGQVGVGDRVNLEIPRRASDELGGHNVHGHVESKSPILEIQDNPGDFRM